MRRSLGLFAVVVVAIAIAWPLRPLAQSQGDLELRAAMETETMKGDVRSAITQYQAIVQKLGKSDRSTAATALLRLAGCYEKLGSPQAQQVLEQIVRDYADQDAATTAKRRLASATPSSQQPSTRLLGSHYSRWDGITADARFAAWTDWDTGDLVIRDLSAGSSQRVVRGSSVLGETSWAEWGAFSPDRTQIAYAWFDDKVKTQQLRVVSLQGGATPTVVFDRYPEYRNVDAVAWAPAGNAILVTVMRPDNSIQLGWVSVKDGAIQVLKTFDRWRTTYGNSLGRVSLSPNGRFIAYAVREREDVTDQHVFILSADGSSETMVSDHAGSSNSPVWTPDGRQLLFVADWSGTNSLWRIDVSEGRPAGKANVVKADVGRIEPIGVTTSGSVYYNYQYGAEDHSYVCELTPSDIARPIVDFSGGYAAWSPDGREVAFVRTGGGSARTNLVVRDSSGAEHVYSERAIVNRAPLWLHNRRAVIVYTLPDQPAPQTIEMWLVDLKDGHFTPIPASASPQWTATGFRTLSPDDRTIYVPASAQTARPVSFDDIISVDVATGRQQLVATLPATGNARTVARAVGLAVSPDGKALAVLTRLGDRDPSNPTLSTAALYVIDVPTGKLQLISTGFRNNTDAKAAWAPDGSRIYFVDYAPAVGKQPSGWRLMSVPAGGGTARPTTLTRIGLMSAREPGGSDALARTGLDRLSFALENLVLSPDGTRVLFSGALNPKYEVWALDHAIR